MKNRITDSVQEHSLLILFQWLLEPARLPIARWLEPFPADQGPAPARRLGELSQILSLRLVGSGIPRRPVS